MMFPTRNSSKLIILTLVLITAFGCQSKKKAMQARNAAAEKAKMEQEAADRKLQAEEQARKAAEEQARREAERRASENSATPSTKLNQYFGAIAGSSNVSSANANINEALSLFASPEAPVLIVISEEGGTKDYDKPTTIKQYLNYLKDQKKNPNAIADIKTNGEGKITELELKKN